MEKRQKTTTSFVHDASWYAIALMGVTAAIIVMYVIARVALFVHARMSSTAETTQALVWETVKGASEMAPWILAIVVLVLATVLVGEFRKLKVTSAVTQENQTIVISPDGNPLHSVQISTGTHVRFPDQITAEVASEEADGSNLELFSLDKEPRAEPRDESQENSEKDSRDELQEEIMEDLGENFGDEVFEDEDLKNVKQPKTKKRQNSDFGKSWHHFCFKIRNVFDNIRDYFRHEDDDEGIEGWVIDQEDLGPITKTDSTSEQLKKIDQELIDLDAEVSGPPSVEEINREQDRQDIEAKLEEAQAKLDQEKRDQEPDVVSGNTGKIAQAIDRVFEQPEDGVNQIIDECNSQIGKDVKSIVNQTHPQDTRLEKLSDGSMTGKEFSDTQAKMSAALEEDGFNPLPMEYDDVVTSLATPPIFSPEVQELVNLFMRLYELMQRHNIKSQADLMSFLAKSKSNDNWLDADVEEETADETALNQLCLRHHVEVVTVERAIVVNYPDQDSITLEMAVQMEDLSLKHRAIAHNLGLFPEELDNALGQLHVGIAEINTPDDIKTLWNVVSISIASTGLRSGYDPRACLRSKAANIAAFVDTDKPKKLESTSGSAKVFQFPGSDEFIDNAAVVGTGKIPVVGDGNISKRRSSTGRPALGTARMPKW